jgi:serine/threonine protein phosphatase 1
MMSKLLQEILEENKKLTHSFFEIEKNELGRILVIPDTHGCLKTLKSLVQKINLTTNDQLFFLGDYLDRGPDSLGIIDYILELMNRGFNVYPLRGNHEQKVLDHYIAFKQFKIYHPDFEIDDLEESDIERYLNFLYNLPQYYKIGNFYLVHAGFNFESENPFDDYESMMHIREFMLPVKGFDYRIIHGHTPKTLEEIELSISNTEKVIDLDNACFHTKNENFGRLLCLDLDNSILYKEQNIEFQV